MNVNGGVTISSYFWLLMGDIQLLLCQSHSAHLSDRSLLPDHGLMDRCQRHINVWVQEGSRRYKTLVAYVYNRKDTICLHANGALSGKQTFHAHVIAAKCHNLI